MRLAVHPTDGVFQRQRPAGCIQTKRRSSNWLHGCVMLLGLGLVFGELRFFTAEWLRPILLIVAPCLAGVFASRPREAELAILSPPGLAMAALSVLALGNAALGHDVFPSAFGPKHYLTVAGVIGMYLAFLAAMVIKADPKLTRTAEISMLIGALSHAAAVVFLGSHILHEGTMRKTGLLTDPNIVLLYVLPPFCMALGLGTSKRWRVVLGVSGLLICAAVLRTVSRMGLVSLGVAASAFVLLQLLRPGRATKVVQALLLIGGALSCIQLSTAVSGDIGTYLSRYRHRADLSAHRDFPLAERLLWLDAVMEQNWASVERLGGTGYRGTPGFPHNTFVDTYFLTGVPGFAIIVALFIMCGARSLKDCWAQTHSALAWAGAVAGSVTWLSLTLVLSALSMFPNKLIWYLLGFTCVAVGPRGEVGSLLTLPNMIPGGLRRRRVGR